MDDGEGSGGLSLPSLPVRKMRLLNLVMIVAVFPFCLTGCTKEESTEGFFALCPLGKVDGNLLDQMRRFVEIAYGSPCKVMPLLPLPSRTYNAVRKQYRASELLDYLEENAPKGARKLVGVTEKDIYTREMNFIFGLANSPGKCCVVSTARLHESFWGNRENELLLRRRAFMIVYHELGHTFRIKHCNKIECAMCYHNSLYELDAGNAWFCPDCGRKLEKALGRLPDDRELRIAEFLSESGLKKDAQLHTEGKGTKE